MNKALIFLVFAAMLVAITAIALRYTGFSTEITEDVMEIASAGGSLVALCVMMANGTLYGSRRWKLIAAFAMLTLIGALFKILHYASDDAFIIIGNTGILLTYLVHFTAKSNKIHLDFLKLLWVLSYSVISILIIAHVVPREFVGGITAIFWLTFIDFAYLELTQKKSQ